MQRTQSLGGEDEPELNPLAQFLSQLHELPFSVQCVVCFEICMFIVMCLECFVQCVQCLACIENSVYIEMKYAACNLEGFVQCVFSVWCAAEPDTPAHFLMRHLLSPPFPPQSSTSFSSSSRPRMLFHCVQCTQCIIIVFIINQG